MKITRMMQIIQTMRIINDNNNNQNNKCNNKYSNDDKMRIKKISMMIRMMT